MTLKVSNFTQCLLNIDFGVDNIAVEMNDSSVAVATTEGCCTNLLPAARATVECFFISCAYVQPATAVVL